MSKLVIAEKPMLARDIARAITGKEVSESARLPISGNTNANDWALTADGTIDSARLDATAGFWFGNNTVLDADGNATTGDCLPSPVVEGVESQASA